jgi:hypothetical protein
VKLPLASCKTVGNLWKSVRTKKVSIFFLKSVPLAAEIALFCATILGMARLRTLESSGKFSRWTAIFIALLIVAGSVTFYLRGVDIFSQIAAATSSLSQVPATLYLIQYEDGDPYVGETRNIDIAINARTPINAVGATIKFPQDSLEVLGFSKEKSFFDLWTEETAINEDTGEIHFSGGTTRAGGLMGTGTVLTITVRAKKAGTQTLSIKDSEVYADDGKGTLLINDSRTLSFNALPQPVSIASGARPTTISNSASTNSLSQPSKPLPKSADLNGDGVINLIDMSIMIIHMMMAPYDQRYDLNMDGNINISDLSILLSQVR